jgi:hypothetical protein
MYTFSKLNLSIAGSNSLGSLQRSLLHRSLHLLDLYSELLRLLFFFGN